MHLATLLMLKNEEKRVHITLNSLIGTTHSLVVFDTGNTDNTVEIVTEFCKANNIILRLKVGAFIDFSTSRNESLAFADTFEDIDFILLMDCNDELRGGDKLLKFLEGEMTTADTAYMVNQEWWSGMTDIYSNVRLVKPRNRWRYTGVVHEYFVQDGIAHPELKKVPPTVVLFQDRCQDDDKSGKRFIKDKELLLKEHMRDPKRTPFSILFSSDMFLSKSARRSI